MAVVIALRPDDDRGREILDRLQKRIELEPISGVASDGTRRYHLEDEANVDALDEDLDRIHPDWRDHLTNWRD
ncbi:MAG TPA: hypothetical protein VKA47_11035 [Solirubrobacterales bacterium]|nr:hypothetical protein [Solirubrobacterales bacterium]